MTAYMERGKLIVAPAWFQAYARAGSFQERNESGKYKWWENFDRFDILIIGGTANIHFVIILVIILQHTIIGGRKPYKLPTN